MLTKLLWQAVQSNPDKAAIVQGDRRISYADLYRLASSLAEGLVSLGIGPSDCVALVLPNCPEFVISFFACARLGAILLPLNPSYTQGELERFLVDGKTKIIITDAERLPVCQQVVDNFNENRHLIVVGNSSTHKAIAFEHLIKPIDLTPPVTALTGPALYLYTSGSTSAYKRLCCTQENLYYEAHNFVETLGLTANDAILCTVPLYHSYGFGNGLLDAAYLGATLVLLEPVIENGYIVEAPFASRSQRVLQLIEQENIRFFPAVPYQFATLADLPDEIPADFSKLKWCVSSGDVLSQAVYQRFLTRFGIAIRSLYGSTEAGSICLNTDPTEQMAFGSLGLPLRNVTIEIRDEHGHVLPPHENGAIWVKSPVIPPTGYDNRPELSEHVFRDGYYETGDIGQKNERGHLIITGRKQTFVDVGGYKVDIGEVEEVLQSHPHVKEAVALGVALPAVGEIIKAVVVTDGQCTEVDIMDYCRERLATYKLPRIIESRDSLPRSSLGKVLKKDLQSFDDAQVLPLFNQTLLNLGKLTREQQLDQLAHQLQVQVAATLQIDISQIARSTSFQSLGFDSIRATELQNRLSHLTGLALSITLLWNHPSIDELAMVLLDRLANSITVDNRPKPSQPIEFALIANSDLSFTERLNTIDLLADADVDAFFRQPSLALSLESL